MTKLSSNIFYSCLLLISQIAIPFITFPYVTRILGPEHLGYINYIDSICQNFILIGALGLPLYGIKEVAKVKFIKEDLDKLMSELLLINFISTGICLIFFFAIAFQLLHIDLPLALLASLSIISPVFMIEWFFQGKEDFKYIAFRGIASRLFAVLLLFLLVKDKGDFVNYYLVVVCTTTINATLNFFRARKSFSFVFTNLNLKRHLKPLLLILSSSIAVSLYTYLDNVILGIISKPVFVGFYSTSVKINKLALSLVTAISTALIPQIAIHHDKANWIEIDILIEKSVRFVGFVGFYILFIFIIFHQQIVELIAGNEYAPASLSFAILSPIIVFIGLNNIFGVQILTSFGHEKLFLRAVLVGMTVSLLLNFILIPKLNHIGAAISNMTTELVVTVLTFYYSSKHTKVKMQLLPLLVYATLALVVVLPSREVFLQLPYTKFTNLFIVTSLAGLTYAGILIYIIKDKFVLEFYNVILLKLKK